MKSYLSLREAAEKWACRNGESINTAQRGAYRGAQRIGKAWAIPADAQKPGDPRRARRAGKKRSGKNRFRRAARPDKPDAPDEYGLCAGEVPGNGGGHGPRPAPGTSPRRSTTISQATRRKRRKRRKPTSQAPTWGRGCPPACSMPMQTFP